MSDLSKTLNKIMDMRMCADLLKVLACRDEDKLPWQRHIDEDEGIVVNEDELSEYQQNWIDDCRERAKDMNNAN